MIFWCSIFVLFVFQGIFMLGRWNWYPAYNKTSEEPNFKERWPHNHDISSYTRRFII